MQRLTPFSEVIHLDKHAPASVEGCGYVSLVGAGPGDSDLLTIKALRVIEQADLILYDRLVSEEIRSLFPASTVSIYVGKSKDRHSIPQDQLNELMVKKAQQGLHVCRLKGGDSFVFGRGGEEMLDLKDANISVEVVPGITAASGCTSYAGIPLTHRGISQGCTFITAHAETSLNVDWKSLAGLQHTIVFYMGLSKAPFISSQLQQAGMNSATPAAIIENGCCKQQRVITGSIAELQDMVLREDIQSPALIVVGEVVTLSDRLNWLEKFTAQQTLNEELVNTQKEKLSA